MALSQTNRLLQVTTPLGENTLVVTGFRGTEHLSRLFSFELDLIAENSTTIDFSQVVGKRNHPGDRDARPRRCCGVAVP